MMKHMTVVRWLLVVTGTVLVVASVLVHRGISDPPLLQAIVFPSSWALGLVFFLVGFGNPEYGNKDRRVASMGEQAPGFGQKKNSTFGDGPFGGHDGGSGGDG